MSKPRKKIKPEQVAVPVPLPVAVQPILQPVVTVDVCEERHRRVDETLLRHGEDIVSLKRMVQATLIFAIVTLITILLQHFLP